ncbi:MAG: hypothetical protein NT062_39040 [Proteobacteria bacterium]|nr:hypothetical protein [Pseudomonadota bacterium]
MRGLAVCSFVLGLLGPGCGDPGASKSPPPPVGPPCAQVGDHVIHLFAPVDDYARSVGAAFTARCTADAWPDPAKACILATTTVETPQNCNVKLSDEQRQQLEAALTAIEMRELPPACTRYETVLALVAKCEALPAAMRAELATRLATAKATWTEQTDKRELGPVCQNALTAVKQAAAACPGADAW